MGFLNNGYILKLRSLPKKYALSVLILLAILVGAIAFLNSRNNTISIYEFNSGLILSFDLNNWKATNTSDLGYTIVNNSGDVSILLTNVKLEDNNNSTLSEIVDNRIAAINKDNIKIEKEEVKINGLDFYKISTKDVGDENIKPDEGTISYVTLYNRIYTSAQIVFKSNSDISEAQEIVNSIKPR